MAIITISRELAALGDETATELSKLLGFRLVNKLCLEERMKSYGNTDKSLEKYDEKKPSFWASLSQDRDDYLHYLKTAIIEEIETDSESDTGTIIIGRGAAAMLKDVPGVVSVFLTAPPDIRCERVKSYFHCEEKRARQIIEQSDSNRSGFHQYFFDMEWKAPSNYHIVLNTRSLHPADCAGAVKYLLTKTIDEAAEEASAKKISEMGLGISVVHHIMYERNLPIHFLEAEASSSDDGAKVTLYGVTNSPALVETALDAAKEVPGVSKVSSEIQIVHEYGVSPQGGVIA
jgi:cytidylate kinase